MGPPSPRRWRPSRYGIAALLGGAVLLVATASSILSFLVRQVPARASLFGLPAVALIVAGSYHSGPRRFPVWGRDGALASRAGPVHLHAGRRSARRAALRPRLPAHHRLWPLRDPPAGPQREGALAAGVDRHRLGGDRLDQPGGLGRQPLGRDRRAHAGPRTGSGRLHRLLGGDLRGDL